MRKLGLVFVLVAWVAPAWATVITTGDVDPGGAGTQPDPWHIPISLGVGNTGSGTLNVAADGLPVRVSKAVNKSSSLAMGVRGWVMVFSSTMVKGSAVCDRPSEY